VEVSVIDDKMLDVILDRAIEQYEELRDHVAEGNRRFGGDRRLPELDEFLSMIDARLARRWRERRAASERIQ
jgi:hypothetical protein